MEGGGEMSRGYLHERGSAQYDALTDSQTVIFTEYGFRARTVNFDRKRPRNGHPVHDAETVERPELKAPQAGSTVLDRVHQAMILFATGRGEALRRFLVEEGIGKDARFWKLAQSLSALYPSGIDEKRWVDGVLARKKGLGL